MIPYSVAGPPAIQFSLLLSKINLYMERAGLTRQDVTITDGHFPVSTAA
jgi:hypothetical protein